MTTLTLADLELPPGTLDGFSPEQIADVVQAATDGAQARIGIILGRVPARTLVADALGLGSSTSSSQRGTDTAP